jgi:hypothetical protein
MFIFPKFCLIFSCEELWWGKFWKLFSIDYMFKKKANFFFFFYIIHLIQCLHLRCGHILWKQLTDFVASLNFKTLVLGSLRKWKGCKKSQLDFNFCKPLNFFKKIGEEEVLTTARKKKEAQRNILQPKKQAVKWRPAIKACASME